MVRQVQQTVEATAEAVEVMTTEMVVFRDVS
jgi:hypothetical protein